MKKLIPLVLLAAPFVVVYSCHHDSILPEQQVSFAGDVLPIIQSSCQHSGCHDTLSPGTFSLIDYNSVMHEGHIVAGKPNESELYQAVTGSGEEFMPQAPYPALTDRSLKLIYIWIAQGAKDN